MPRKLVTDPQKLLNRCLRIVASQTIKLRRASMREDDPLSVAHAKQLVDYAKLLKELVQSDRDAQDAIRKDLQALSDAELRARARAQLEKEEADALGGVS